MTLRTLTRDVIFGVLSVPVTVTRPYPNETPAVVTGVWLTWHAEDAVSGGFIQRREPMRVIAIRSDLGLGVVPRGTVLEAPEDQGGAVKRWRVDGIEQSESGLVRYRVIPNPDPNDAEARL